MSPSDARLTVHSADPLVGGPPLPLLRRRFVTPAELFFVRNHGPVPEIDAASWRLEVSGAVATPLSLSLDELRGRFPRAEVTATLQCAGNRRRELSAVAPTPGEVPWDADGIGTAVWSGARLADVLAAAGVAAEAAHAAFEGVDRVERHGERFGFGGSVPIAKALAPECLLADTMNGAPLAPEHGFPLRALVPGVIGARSVKWLSHIRLQASPSDNYFQARAYRLFPPSVTAESVRWEDGRPLHDNALTAVICEPETAARLAPGPLKVRGYALAPAGRRVARLEVSADGGATWTAAALEGDEPWAWQFWEATVVLRPGGGPLVARAFDDAGNGQPERLESVWNFKGYLNHAWHRVPVVVAGYQPPTHS